MSVAKVMWRYNGDVNSASGENWKEPPSSTILTDSSFNGDSNEENLNANLLLLIQNLLAIRENKWDIKHMKILPTQQKVIREILEKVFIYKNFAKCKTLRVLKIDVFEISDNKNIGKIFSKHELLFLNQANSSSDPS